VTQEAAQALAIGCAALALAAGGLGMFGLWRPASVVNAILALVVLAFAVPEPLAYAWNPQAFIARLGRAAVSDLPLAIILAGLSAAALAGSGLALAGRHLFFWPGWAANLPAVALFLYFAFWFHIF
jgi:hypothetical protein